jgi:hypothetical protein
VILADPVSGDVSTTSNLEDEAEVSLLEFVLASRAEGSYTSADATAQAKH